MNVKRIITNNSSPRKPTTMTSDDNIDQSLSPELTPIVTLLSAQTHRRYHEGVFMLFYDLNSDGKPGDRKWHEVYGILTGTQLAYWDANKLTEFRNNPEALFTTSSKPQYINFTDSIFNGMVKLPSSSGDLENVIVVSTTLKNRYILQFKSSRDLSKWYLSLRLSTFEYTCLQEAYTGALLSARGSRLSDIRVILAEKRYDHEDWVSVRYGSGMAWKRCYAVVEPSTSKRSKFSPGKISFYENEKKQKKSLMAVVTNASAVYAIYPQSHTLIDHSTMLKVEASITFINSNTKKKESPKETSIFLMPEQHSAVPGFDTLIRFLIPLLDSYGLYGRPKRLNANKNDLKSLLFGLPTLPHVHYLEVDDLLMLTKNPYIFNWDVKEWFQQIKNILKSKLDQGYDGCGSSRGLNAALNSLNVKDSSSSSNSNSHSSSPTISSRTTFNSSSNPLPGVKNNSTSNLPIKPTVPNNQVPTNHTGGSLNSHPNERFAQSRPIGNNIGAQTMKSPQANLREFPSLSISPEQAKHQSLHLSNIYSDYSELSSPSDQFNSDRLLAHETGNTSKLPYPKNYLLDENKDSADISSNNQKESGLKLPYPKNDFSDSEDESMSPPQTGSVKKQTLSVPGSVDSSTSSIRSPMTQYNDFNAQFQQSVKPQAQNESMKTRLIGPQPIHDNGTKPSLMKSQPNVHLNQMAGNPYNDELPGEPNHNYNNFQQNQPNQMIQGNLQKNPNMAMSSSDNLIRPIGNSKPLHGPQRLPLQPSQQQQQQQQDHQYPSSVQQQPGYPQANTSDQRLPPPPPSQPIVPQLAPQQLKYGQSNPYQKPHPPIQQYPASIALTQQYSTSSAPPQQYSSNMGPPPQAYGHPPFNTSKPPGPVGPPQQFQQRQQYGRPPPGGPPPMGAYAQGPKSLGPPPQGRPFGPQSQNNYRGPPPPPQQQQQRMAPAQNQAPDSFRSYQNSSQNYEYQYQPQVQIPKAPHKPGMTKRIPPPSDAYGLTAVSGSHFR